MGFENFKIIKGSERHKFGNSYVKEMMIQTPAFFFWIGSCFACVGLMSKMYFEQKKDQRWPHKPFKKQYHVYRPDDPRIERLRARPDYYNQEGTIPEIKCLAHGRSLTPAIEHRNKWTQQCI